jgi:hypothetical protein
MPPAPGVNAPEVAVPLVNVTRPPTGVPPLAQPLAVVNGPQTKKLTVPDGIPPVALPVTVALSVFELPSVMVGAVGMLEVSDDAVPTVKHSVLLPSVDGE